MRLLFLFFICANAATFPENFVVNKSTLLNEQQQFFRSKLDKLKLDFNDNKQLLPIMLLVDEFLALKKNPVIQRHYLAKVIINFNKKVELVEKEVNDVRLKILLAAMKVTYIPSEYNPSQFSFVNSLIIPESEDSFLNYLIYNSLRELKQYFLEKEWDKKNYYKKYLQSTLALIKSATEQNQRIIYQEIYKQLTSFGADVPDLERVVDDLPEELWLKWALKLEFINYSASNRVKTNTAVLAMVRKNMLALAEGKSYLPETMALSIRVNNLYFTQQINNNYFYFIKGITKAFDYYPLYESYMQRLNINDKIAFFLECFATKRFDTFVPSIIILGNYGSLKLFDSLVNKILDGYAESSNGYYANCQKLFYSVIYHSLLELKSYDEAYTIVKRSGFDLLELQQVQGFKQSIEESFGYLQALQETDNFIIEGLYDEIDWKYKLPQKRSVETIDELLLEIAKLQKKIKLSFFAKSTVRGLQAILMIERRFYQGEWVDLTFDEKLLLWRTFRGQFRYQDKNTVIGSSNFFEQGQYLAHRAYFSPPYEVELTVRPIINYLHSQPLPVGLIIGKMHSQIYGRYFYINEGKGAGIYNPYMNKESILLDFEKGRYRIKVRVYKDSFQFWINDKLIKHTDKSRFSPLLLSVGVVPMGSGVVEYKNIRIRSLSEKK